MFAYVYELISEDCEMTEMTRSDDGWQHRLVWMGYAALTRAKVSTRTSVTSGCVGSNAPSVDLPTSDSIRRIHIQ